MVRVRQAGATVGVGEGVAEDEMEDGVSVEDSAWLEEGVAEDEGASVEDDASVEDGASVEETGTELDETDTELEEAAVLELTLLELATAEDELTFPLQ